MFFVPFVGNAALGGTDGWREGKGREGKGREGKGREAKWIGNRIYDGVLIFDVGRRLALMT